MINFFIIEVEENFSMDKIDSIFHVIFHWFRQWDRKAPFLMTSGCLFSTKHRIMLTSQAWEILSWCQLIIGVV